MSSPVPVLTSLGVTSDQDWDTRVISQYLPYPSPPHESYSLYLSLYRWPGDVVVAEVGVCARNTHKNTFYRQTTKAPPNGFYGLAVTSDVSWRGNSDEYALKSMWVLLKRLCSLSMHRTVVTRSCVEPINVRYDLSVCEQENAERSLQREPTRTFQLCLTFRPLTIIAFSGFNTLKGVVGTLCNVIAPPL